MKVCGVGGCERKHFGVGLCNMHHSRLRRHGSLDPPRGDWHGTLHGYRFHRCRCDRCVLKWHDYQRTWYVNNRGRAHIYDRKHDLKATYGITLEEFDEMLARQGGGCAVCGNTATDGRKRYLEVDHCHETGRVRGILCNGCNVAAGRLKNDPDRALALAAYLRGHAEVAAA